MTTTLSRRRLVRTLVPLFSGSLFAALAFSVGGCGGESTSVADVSNPALKKSLVSKYPDLGKPLPPPRKRRGHR
jgi:hypothetical protein